MVVGVHRTILGLRRGRCQYPNGTPDESAVGACDGPRGSQGCGGCLPGWGGCGARPGLP